MTTSSNTDSRVHLSVVPVSVVPEPKLKHHVSYSEIATWMDCAFKHKLKYVDRVDSGEATEHTEFGKVIHEALESFLKTRTMPDHEQIRQRLTKKFSKLTESTGVVYGEDSWHNTLPPILNEVPDFLNQKFGTDWETVSSEQELYEPIEQNPDMFFKGFVDAIIKQTTIKHNKPKQLYWILDWKSTGWGWTLDQKTNIKKTLQLILYKAFVAKKLGIPLEDLRCGFVLLKRQGKPGNHCELVTVSVGPKTLDQGLQILTRMVNQAHKGLNPKNRESCRYCPYYNTVHCP